MATHLPRARRDTNGFTPLATAVEAGAPIEVLRVLARPGVVGLTFGHPPMNAVEGRGGVRHVPGLAQAAPCGGPLMAAPPGACELIPSNGQHVHHGPFHASFAGPCEGWE